MSRHLVLKDRKALCGKLCVLDGLAQNATALEAADLGEQLEQFGNLLLGHALEVRKEPGALDSAIRQLDEQLETAIGATPGIGAHRPHFEKATEVVRSRIRSVNCLQCAGSEALICRDYKEDLSVLDGAAHCLQPINGMFSEVLHRSLDFYRTFSSIDPNRFDATRLLLATSRLESPGVLVECPHIDASVDASDSSTHHSSIVNVKLYLERLGLSSFLCLPYVLFHELICHAWHGVADRVRGKTGSSDSFAEGWMDFVAEKRFESAFGEPESPFVHRQRVQGAILSRARSNHLTPAPRAVRGQRAMISTGRAAASTVFAELSRAGSEGENAFYRVTCDLNVSNLVAGRKRLVARIFREMEAPGRDYVRWLGGQFLEYEGFRDLPVFLSEAHSRPD